MKRSIRVLLAGTTLLVAAGAAGSGPATAQSAARIHLIHGIPATDVDVDAGGAEVFADFKYGETKDLSALAGQTLTDLKVLAAGTETVAIDAGDVALPATGNYTIIAHLTADGTPALAVFENDVSALAAGEGRLVVRHAAAAPAVDVKANGAVAFANVVNGKEGSADLPAGTVSAEVVPAGASEPVVIGPADLSVKAGESLIVYAVGSLDAGTLGVLTESISGLGADPARVETGNTPIDDDDGLPIAAIALFAIGAAAIGATLVRRSSRASI